MSKFESSWWKTACAVVVLCAATAIRSHAQTFTTLVNFNGSNGIDPSGPLVQGIDGNLYGTTTSGGLNGSGTVFKMTPAGILTTLYSFCACADCTDGSEPGAGLALGNDGNFYGTTTAGGANGFGTVFKITPAGTLTTLHSFDLAHGVQSRASLVQGTDGNFYGAVEVGGANTNGALFKITPQGVFTTLHSFDFTDGSFPSAALIQVADGNFYGTTSSGGTEGHGTVFKTTAAGTLTTVHNFQFTADGGSPNGLVQGSDGNFYGTAALGGLNGNGEVFKITPQGLLTTLYRFDSSAGDGTNPAAGLIQATDGNFYGVTPTNGANGAGTIFEITPGGTLTTLYDFAGPGGGGPSVALLQATNGAFYGVTSLGGTSEDGIVFSLDVGLGPFVETLPAGGKAGASVRILGSALTGTTAVTFNGVPATFTVVSSTLVTTMVPAGASTGPVQVTTPSGTLTSNLPFRVR